MTKPERYPAIDGVRTYSIFGILIMHVCANSGLRFEGFLYNRLIPAFTDFVFLFMMVSAFGMCCGYFDKISNGEIRIEEFYKKRYQKIWPFFTLLCCLDFAVSPGKDTLYMLFADLTLCFALLPNAQISVIGVGWTLGLIFVFYLLFPFFCFLLGNKRRAWFSFVVAIVFNVLCTEFFFDTNHMPVGFLISSRTNIVYSSVFFLAGGLIFLYRNQLSGLSCNNRVVCYGLTVMAAILYFANTNTFTRLLLGSLLLILALKQDDRILSNKVTGFLSSISFEIYLCHMVVYRVVEKTKIFCWIENTTLECICLICSVR